MKKEFNLTKKQAIDIFILCCHARIKLQGKWRTLAEKYHEKFEKELILKDLLKYEKQKTTR